MFKAILRLLIRGRLKDAWAFYSFVGKEKLPVDFKDEDFEVYYPEID